MGDPKGYYTELGITKTATTDEIKQTYRKLALKWHPDKNPDNVAEATRIFQRISEAYSVLSDEKKREQYDTFGSVEDFQFDYNDFVGHFDFASMFNMVFDGFDLLNGMMGMGMGSHHGRSKRHKTHGHGFRVMGGMGGMSSKKAHDKFMKMFTGGMGHMGGKSTDAKEKPKEEEGWETEEEVSDDEDTKPSQSTGKGGKEESKAGEDNEDDWDDEDEDDEEDFEEEEANDEAARKAARAMYGAEDADDYLQFDKFMAETEAIFIIPMFAAENSKKIDAKRTKCNLCKKIFDDDSLFEHFTSSHRKDIDSYVAKQSEEEERRGMGGLGKKGKKKTGIKV
jgi:curved DNA-binding protein CbpA